MCQTRYSLRCNVSTVKSFFDYYLPKGIARKAIHNTRTRDLTKVVSSVCDALSQFSWGQSKEGYAYWSYMYWMLFKDNMHYINKKEHQTQDIEYSVFYLND